MLNLTGLWLGKTKAGDTYMNGNMNQEASAQLAELMAAGEVRFMVFKNAQKNTDKHPDYNLVAVQNERQQPPPQDNDEIPF